MMSRFSTRHSNSFSSTISHSSFLSRNGLRLWIARISSGVAGNSSRWSGSAGATSPFPPVFFFFRLSLFCSCCFCCCFCCCCCCCCWCFEDPPVATAADVLLLFACCCSFFDAFSFDVFSTAAECRRGVDGGDFFGVDLCSSPGGGSTLTVGTVSVFTGFDRPCPPSPPSAAAFVFV